MVVFYNILHQRKLIELHYWGSQNISITCLFKHLPCSLLYNSLPIYQWFITIFSGDTNHAPPLTTLTPLVLNTVYNSFTILRNCLLLVLEWRNVDCNAIIAIPFKNDGEWLQSQYTKVYSECRDGFEEKKKERLGQTTITEQSVNHHQIYSEFQNADTQHLH